MGLCDRPTRRSKKSKFKNDFLFLKLTTFKLIETNMYQLGPLKRSLTPHRNILRLVIIHIMLDDCNNNGKHETKDN